MARLVVFSMVYLLMALCIGCDPRESAAPEGAITVAVSIEPQRWLVEQIGGERVDVTALVPANASPATYQPTDAQISRVMSAAVYFRIGVPFENGSWFKALSSSQKLEVVDTRRGITLREMVNHAHDHEQPGHHGHAAKDPHIWLSPRVLKTQANTIADSLLAIDPEYAEHYQANLQRVLGELDAVDTTIRQALKTAEGKSFFVFHPAWGYFADEYGLTQVAIEIEGKTPTDRELTVLQSRARESEARAVFVQPQISGVAAKAVAEAIGGRVIVIDPLAYDVPNNLQAVADQFADALADTEQTTHE